MMTTIDETILASAADTMVKRCASLEYQLAACQEDLAECQDDLASQRFDMDLAHDREDRWRAEAERRQALLVTAMQELKTARLLTSAYVNNTIEKRGL